MAIIDTYTVYRTHIVLKFAQSLQYSSVTADKFLLQTQDATPIEYDFKEIQMGDDYNSITRVLTLYFRDLPQEGVYDLAIDGLRSAAGNDLSGTLSNVRYDYDNVDDTPDEDEFTVEDKSIKTDIVIDQDPIELATSTPFHVKSTDPENGSIFVDSDYNNGVIAITFNKTPDSNATSAQHFKIQRKEIALTLKPWETITPGDITLNASTIQISLPSNDATPVYDEAGATYFEYGYKYRVRLSADITAEPDEGETEGDKLGSSYELAFATDVAPLYIDPEEFIGTYPEASLVEIMELVHRFSSEVNKLYAGAELPLKAYEYIRAAVECSLYRTYAFSYGMGSAESITLGDLSVDNRKYPSYGSLNRGSAVTPCEIAAVLRDELIRGTANIRAVRTGRNFKNPMPKRQIKHAERF